MIINSLEQMESIVRKNKQLSWQGWDVVQSFIAPTGYLQKNGAYIEGRWYTQRRFNITSKGWEFPEKLVS